jgi:transposase
MTNKSNIFMGIDVSKDTLDISVKGNHFKIKNTGADIKNFIKKVAKTLDINLCVLESTGGYEKLIITMLNEADIAVHRAHPNKVYAFAKAAGHFAKTDKLDSKLLEKYAEFIKDDNPDCIKLSKEQIALQELRSVQKNLEMSLHASQCRAKLLSGKALAYTEKQIGFIKKQLADIEKEIDKIISYDEIMSGKQKILTSYKGVGKRVANGLIAELPELGTLNSKEIASLVGVAPKTTESGKKTCKAHINGGRFFVRKLLYMSALVAANYNDKMSQMYRALLEQGKPAKIALTAIMRKIIVCLNSMLKNKKFYEA